MSEYLKYKTSRYYTRPNGRSYYYITCPICDCVVKAYIWSLAGSGKKCKCGAIHTTYGTIKRDEKK
jgi:hypothetical protein